MNYAKRLVEQVQNVKLDYYPADIIIPLIDLTRLEKDNDEQAIIDLCQKAQTPKGYVAAICVYPEFIQTVKTHKPNKKINIATVVNFPDGKADVVEVVQAIEQAIISGADEIDVVLPYHRILAGEYLPVLSFLEACKKACGDRTLKVILETGALKTQEHIEEACRIAIDAGTDFLKTSTGKIENGATLDAVATMLLTIRDYPCVGLKVSGGVRTQEDAAKYIFLAQKVMGRYWTSPQYFRLGASSLLDNLLACDSKT